MSRRPTLDELRDVLLDECLDDQWKTPTECADMLGIGHGHLWYRVALVLERLAADGEIELKTPGSRVRRFRRRPLLRGVHPSRASSDAAYPSPAIRERTALA